MLQSLNREQENRFLTHLLLLRAATAEPLTGAEQAEAWAAVARAPWGA